MGCKQPLKETQHEVFNVIDNSMYWVFSLVREG